MSNTKHTPGPWTWQFYQRASLAEQSISVEAKSGRMICDMGDYPNKEDQANIRLIAAAPEMAKQLRGLAGLLNELLELRKIDETDAQFVRRAFDETQTLLKTLEGTD